MMMVKLLDREMGICSAEWGGVGMGGGLWVCLMGDGKVGVMGAGDAVRVRVVGGDGWFLGVHGGRWMGWRERRGGSRREMGQW